MAPPTFAVVLALCGAEIRVSLFLGPPCCHVSGFLYQHVYVAAKWSRQREAVEDPVPTPSQVMDAVDLLRHRGCARGNYSCLQCAHRLREVCASAFDEALAVEDHQLLS
uniref:Putative secreted protein n=1 Tax=Ixodes ricinus TaxID=34613 RepID=A0A6B0UH89_IXORI